MLRKYDYLILGAGIYGLYAAKLLSKKKMAIAVIEPDEMPFQRASYINQARVHNGYHYPRSFSTAIKSAGYFDRFNKEFHFAINRSFKQIYAIADNFSLASSEQFKLFCNNANIPCIEISAKKYFNDGAIEDAFETKEYAFDAPKIRDWLIEKINGENNVDLYFNYKLKSVEKKNGTFHLSYNDDVFVAPFVLNSTYASVNQVIDKFNYRKFDIKYEIAEITVCDVTDNLRHVGLTIMDGPFFSVMPFGLSGFHSVHSVSHSPHVTSYDSLPVFECQQDNKNCTSISLENCNLCHARPVTAWPYMLQLSKKFLKSDIKLTFKESLLAIKPILTTAELDDSRPTVIVKHSEDPMFVSVLSGKINTIYDLEGILS